MEDEASQPDLVSPQEIVLMAADILPEVAFGGL
jgi:hypothetical protein